MLTFPNLIRFFFFFFNDTATTEIYTLSLHDALPICDQTVGGTGGGQTESACRYRRKLDQRSHLPDQSRGRSWGGWFAPGRPLLQQADPGGFVPAFSCRGPRDQAAHHAL